MNDLFLRACRREPTERTPVWLMRQAGRYLPEYRALRETHDFLTLTREPELAAEVTLQPIRRFGMDAAILFADILTPLAGAGVSVEFNPGPVIAEPIRDEAGIGKLRRFTPETAVAETLETIRILDRELDVPLIGFAGAPFTLACYLVDGQGTKDFALTRTMLHAEPGLARSLLDALAELTCKYLRAQVAAGAKAVQVFDTWAGLLGPSDFRGFLAPGLRTIFDAIRELGVPSIYYVNGGATLLEEIGELGSDVVGIDWRIPLDRAKQILPGDKAVQGNLDPLVLLGPGAAVRERARDVLRRAGDGTGHIFNLGHGIHRKTPVENVETLLETVREGSRR